MTKAIEQLMNEHRLIEQVLGSLESFAEYLKSGGEAERGTVKDYADFFKNFADKCHHGKEEDLLFPAMEKAGIPRAGGPLGVMLSEHVAGRGFVKGMSEAVTAVRKGDTAAARRFAENARNYGALLSQHILKEDRILYPMADARLSPSQQDELAACFAEVEEKVIGHGKHEEYHRLLKELEAAYLG